MNFPEVTESQVKLMHNVCFDPDMSVFSQCAPIPSDPLNEALEANQAAQDVNYLISLGLLNEITHNHFDKVTEMGEKTGRVWRVYEITPIGRAMFGRALTGLPN